VLTSISAHELVLRGLTSSLDEPTLDEPMMQRLCGNEELRRIGESVVGTWRKVFFVKLDKAIPLMDTIV